MKPAKFPSPSLLHSMTLTKTKEFPSFLSQREVVVSENCDASACISNVSALRSRNHRKICHERGRLGR